MDADRIDTDVRLYVYDRVVETGRAPDAGETAEGIEASTDEVRNSFGRLADDHILVLEPSGDDIKMAMPFSAVPTQFEVTIRGLTYWANCAWDAFGIPAMLDSDAKIAARCADCDEQMNLTINGGTYHSEGEVIHFAIPAAKWWDDVRYT